MNMLSLIEALFDTDERGRLTGAAPHFHLIRTREFVVCRCHADVLDPVCARLAGLASRPRGRPGDWARDYAEYIDALAPIGPPTCIRSGLLYAFPTAIHSDGRSVMIDGSNWRLLLSGLDEWIPDAQSGRPMAAVVIDGRAVSLCATVNSSALAHHAGVETLTGYRGRGLAAEAVAKWTQLVRASGAVPFYATTFDNISSQAVARRLALDLIGSEFSVRCGGP